MRRARDLRQRCGHIFLLVQLLDQWVDVNAVFAELPIFYTYAGFDCSAKWATYLRDAERPSCLAGRLRECLGVTQEEITTAQKYVAQGEWTLAQVAAVLDELMVPTQNRPPFGLRQLFERYISGCERSESSSNGQSSTSEPCPVKTYLDGWKGRRLCHQGPPGHAAMPPRLRDRSSWVTAAHPTLRFACKMCEAEFPNRKAMQTHIDMTHGTHRWYVSALNTFLELSPYVPTCTEKRAVVERFSNAQQHASVDPENESHRVQPSPEAQLSLASGRIVHRCAEALARSENRATACPDPDVSKASPARWSGTSVTRRLPTPFLKTSIADPQPRAASRLAFSVRCCIGQKILPKCSWRAHAVIYQTLLALRASWMSSAITRCGL